MKAKRRYRKLERAVSRSLISADTWRTERRAYRKLVSGKRQAFWSSLIGEQRYKPRDGSSRISAPISRLPERSYPGD